MDNIDNWMINHKKLIAFFIILMFIFVIFIYIPFRPAFLRIKDAPDKLAELNTKVELNFAKLFKWTATQDSLNRANEIIMQHIPKIFPVPGARISSKYGQRDSLFHWGVDFAAQTGTPIYATASGRVIKAHYEKGYGNVTEIDSGNGILVIYAHQNTILVAVNEEVKQGQQIGTVGSTGISTGPHAHIEFIQNDKHRDPMKVYQ